MAWEESVLGPYGELLKGIYEASMLLSDIEERLREMDEALGELEEELKRGGRTFEAATFMEQLRDVLREGGRWNIERVVLGGYGFIPRVRRRLGEWDYPRVPNLYVVHSPEEFFKRFSTPKKREDKVFVIEGKVKRVWWEHPFTKMVIGDGAEMELWYPGKVQIPGKPRIRAWGMWDEEKGVMEIGGIEIAGEEALPTQEPGWVSPPTTPEEERRRKTPKPPRYVPQVRPTPRFIPYVPYRPVPVRLGEKPEEPKELTAEDFAPIVQAIGRVLQRNAGKIAMLRKMRIQMEPEVKEMRKIAQEAIEGIRRVREAVDRYRRMIAEAPAEEEKKAYEELEEEVSKPIVVIVSAPDVLRQRLMTMMSMINGWKAGMMGVMSDVINAYSSALSALGISPGVMGSLWTMPTPTLIRAGSILPPTLPIIPTFLNVREGAKRALRAGEEIRDMTSQLNALLNKWKEEAQRLMSEGATGAIRMRGTISKAEKWAERRRRARRRRKILRARFKTTV